MSYRPMWWLWPPPVHSKVTESPSQQIQVASACQCQCIGAPGLEDPVSRAPASAMAMRLVCPSCNSCRQNRVALQAGVAGSCCRQLLQTGVAGRCYRQSQTRHKIAYTRFLSDRTTPQHDAQVAEGGACKKAQSHSVHDLTDCTGAMITSSLSALPIEDLPMSTAHLSTRRRPGTVLRVSRILAGCPLELAAWVMEQKGDAHPVQRHCQGMMQLKFPLPILHPRPCALPLHPMPTSCSTPCLLIRIPAQSAFATG